MSAALPPQVAGFSFPGAGFLNDALGNLERVVGLVIGSGRALVTVAGVGN